MLSVKQGGIFKVFGVMRPGIEPRSPEPLANTLSTLRIPLETLHYDVVLFKNTSIYLSIYLSMCLICLDYIFRMSIDLLKENVSTQKKKRLNKIANIHPAETWTDSNYIDDLALLVNTPAQAESPLHSLEKPAEGISLHVNAYKSELSLLASVWNQ